jgi:threonine dehydrogenase-like Zn-dependent dehydrogenase
MELKGGELFMRTCYAMVLEKPCQFVKKEFPIPEIGPDDLLLKVEMVSICGSDRHLYDGAHKRSSFPKILGHEFVGFVEQIGEQAKDHYSVDTGDRITVEPYISCFSCEFCLTGNYQAHMPYNNFGVGLTCDKPPHLFGAYSQYVFVPKGSKIFKIKPEIPAEAACLSSVIGNGVRWARTKGEVKYGESVVVVGSGAQGLAAVVAAKEAGAYPIIVLGITKDRIKFDIAKEFGADFTVDMQKLDAKEEVKRLTNGRMADLVIECVGVAPTIQISFKLARDCGRVVLCGLSGGKDIAIPTDDIVNNELTVRGGHGQSWDVGAATAIINSSKYPIEKMISHKFPLEKAEEAMQLFLAAPEECVRVALIP